VRAYELGLRIYKNWQVELKVSSLELTVLSLGSRIMISKLRV
jgi:hypothetical protein